MHVKSPQIKAENQGSGVGAPLLAALSVPLPD